MPGASGFCLTMPPPVAKNQAQQSGYLHILFYESFSFGS
jgi:hypothetical protein